MFKISVNSLLVNKRLESLEKQAAEKAYNLAAQDVASKIGEIAQKDVPVMEGILKSSFTIQKVRGIWYLGYNTVYAKYQHEGRDSEGNRIIRQRPGGGKTKFLTGAVERNQKQILQLMSTRFYHYLSQELQKIF